MRFSVGTSLASVKRHDYLPFGEELFATQGKRTAALGYSADAVRQKFTQYERDIETNLDYAHARYYGSTQGRFTSPDPFNGSMAILDPQSMNRYAYVQNSPLIFTDPTGLILGETSVDFAFWGSRAESLPGFGTKWGSYIALYEQQHETVMYRTINNALYPDPSGGSNSSGSTGSRPYNPLEIWFSGYFDENDILTWWYHLNYQLGTENAGTSADDSPRTSSADTSEFVKVTLGSGKPGWGIDVGLILDRHNNLYFTWGPSVGVSLLPFNGSIERGNTYNEKGEHVTSPSAVRQQIQGVSAGWKLALPTTDSLGASGNLKFVNVGSASFPICCSGGTTTTGYGTPQVSFGPGYTYHIPFTGP
jgi:RHS repeat-associated protein